MIITYLLNQSPLWKVPKNIFKDSGTPATENLCKGKHELDWSSEWYTEEVQIQEKLKGTKEETSGRRDRSWPYIFKIIVVGSWQR